MSANIFYTNKINNQTGDTRVIKEIYFDPAKHVDISYQFINVGIDLEIYKGSGTYYKVVVMK